MKNFEDLWLAIMFMARSIAVIYLGDVLAIKIHIQILADSVVLDMNG